MRKQGSFHERKEKMRSILLVLTLITLVGCSGPGVKIDEDADVMVDGGVDVDSMVLPDGSMPDSMTPDVTVVDLCGNDLVNIGETCDDGNHVSNDGCSNECLIEIGWDCNSSVPSVCTPVCGDTLVRGTETCDDGNEVTEACSVYAGDCQVCNNVCQTVTVVGPFCGDTIVNGNEECDDSSASCSKTTQNAGHQVNGSMFNYISQVDVTVPACRRPYPDNATYICALTTTRVYSPAVPAACDPGMEFAGFADHVGSVENALNSMTNTLGDYDTNLGYFTFTIGMFARNTRLCYVSVTVNPVPTANNNAACVAVN